MKTRNSTRNCRLIWIAVCFQAVLTSLVLSSAPIRGFQKKPKGKMVKNVYYSPEGDFRVVVPNANSMGSRMWDEGHETFREVSFTDDLGRAFGLVSLENFHGSHTLESVVEIEGYADAFDWNFVESSWGREIRFIHIQKQSAGITVSVPQSGPNGSITWKVTKPDLVTANAVFAAKDHIYLFVAGVPEWPVEGSDKQKTIGRAKRNLEEFMKGFETITKSK